MLKIRIDIEQAHFTYGLENGVSFTIGKYGSKLGFEREDPSGIYTHSRAYGNAGVANLTGTSHFNLGNVDAMSTKEQLCPTTVSCFH